MNAYTSTDRILLHLQAWSHRPSHALFHLRGIGRELKDSGLLALLAAFGWMVVWFLIAFSRG